MLLGLQACVTLSSWDARRVEQGKHGLPDWQGSDEHVKVHGRVGPSIAGIRRVKVVGKVRRG